MKVLHIMPFWGMGGLQQTVFDLCKFKGGTQPSLLVTTTRKRATRGARFDDLGIPTTTSTNGLEILSLMDAADIINYHTCGAHQKPYEHLLQKTNTPYVLTLHWRTKMPITTQPIICVSRHTARLQHPRNRVFTIHSGIDLERFSPQPRADKKEIIITRVCRPDKCAKYFWRSMYAVLKLIPQTKLWIVGENGKSTERVKFCGYRDDVPDILAQSDIFAYAPEPSMGSFDLVVLEAMAMGLPCVVSDAPCAAESVEHLKTGIIVPFGNAKALAYAVCKLALNGKLRRYLGDNGIQTAKRFDARKMSEKYYAVYKTVISGNEQITL